MTVGALPAPAVVDELAREALKEFPRWLADPGYDPFGLPPLRSAIAARFTQRGLPTAPDQILVTNGAMQALDLIIKVLLRRGRGAIVEIPSYRAALAALEAAGARLRRVPVVGGAWDTEAFAASLRGDAADLAYLIPDFHNPTGALMDERSRRRLIRALRRAGCHTVIDETFVELNLDGGPMPPPAALGGGERAITIGSLSKSVWPGLRVGWVRTEPPLIRRLGTMRASADMASPVFEQLVGARALACLDEIMRERRRLVAVRRDTLAQALHAQLPTWTYERPRGGLFIWAELPERIATSLSVQARERGLHLTPGPLFGGAGLLEHNMRLPYTLPPDALAQAVRMLADVAKAEAVRAP